MITEFFIYLCNYVKRKQLISRGLSLLDRSLSLLDKLLPGGLPPGLFGYNSIECR